MELSVLGGLISLGLYLNKDGIDRNIKLKDNNISKFANPNGKNIYHSKDTLDININENREFTKRFNQINNSDSNIIARSPHPVKFNQLDNVNKKLPIEYNNINSDNFSTIQSFDNIEQFSNYSVCDKVPKEYKNNINNNNKSNIIGISLTGDPIFTNSFKHNNMTPFFGSKIKQNVDEYATKTILENHTGSDSNYMQKEGVKYMFKPEKNISNPNGLESINEQTMDRYYVSNIRNNETPIEKVYVARGLNQGYGWEGTGGFHQSDIRDFATPKTVDELRVKSNPKVVYEGRILPGKLFVDKRELKINLAKNKPETFYEQGFDRLIKTIGAIIKPPVKSEIILKQSHRKRTQKSKQIFGPPNAINKKDQLRSNVRKSNKQQSQSYGLRNAGSSSWNVFSSTPHDYGKNNLNPKNTKRQSMSNSKRIGNIQSSLHNKNVVHNNPNMRKTRKNTIGNNRWASNMQSQQPSKQYIKEPNMVAKTTIRESMTNNNHNGNLGGENKQYINNQDSARTTLKQQIENNNHNGNLGGENKNYVYDTNELAKVTIKQTTENNNHNGNLGGENKNYVYDPNDITKTTIKETMIDNNHNGNINGNNKKHIIYDPNDVLKTTIKETNIDAVRIGNSNRSTLFKGKVYDKDDIPNITLKQTTLITDKFGNVNTQTSGGGYEIDNINAINTNRQFTSTQNIPNPTTNDATGYILTSENIVAPTTLRQSTSDIEYFGNEGPGAEVKPRSYQDMYNSTIKTLRQDVSKGRTPNQQGINKPINSSDIHITTTKSSDYNNKILNSRELNKNSKNLSPDVNFLGDYSTKSELPNRSRFDTSIVNQIQNNPFNKSII